jgi:purine-binding chemotaxis protein CheW
MANPSTQVKTARTTEATDEDLMFVTMCVDKQLFGIEVRNVRDVLREQKITPIPLAPPEVSGSLNLRGRIVTVIDLRRRLRLPASSGGGTSSFVVVEVKGELYSLMVDSVGEVLTTSSASIEKIPANLPSNWKDIATGIYKLEHELLVLVDVQTLLNL